MSIAEFIRESVLRPRLRRPVLWWSTTPTSATANMCLDLTADKVRVVDASRKQYREPRSGTAGTARSGATQGAAGRSC